MRTCIGFIHFDAGLPGNDTHYFYCEPKDERHLVLPALRLLKCELRSVVKRTEPFVFFLKGGLFAFLMQFIFSNEQKCASQL